MKRRTGTNGVMALKVDLEITYDWVSWAFLFDTLNEARLPNTLKVLWNLNLAYGIEHR